MKRLILHIGCEKTGTTSLQNSLSLNRELLLKDEGILYPQSLGKRNHTKLAIYACNADKNLTRFLSPGLNLDEFRQQLRQDFIEEISSSSAERVVISNEWLHPRVRQPVEFNRLKSLLDEVADEVEVVLYVRRQDKLAMSLYSTSLKAGNEKPFTFPFVNEAGSLPYYYDFLSIYRQWKSVFGTQNVRVRIFDRERLYQNDVVADFLHHILDFENENFRFYLEDNRSVNNTGILLIRGLNYLLHLMRKPMASKSARIIRQHLANRFSGTPNLATKDACIGFLRYFDNCNKGLELEYEKDRGEQLKLF